VLDKSCELGYPHVSCGAAHAHAVGLKENMMDILNGNNELCCVAAQCPVADSVRH
jgi:hypothetical protein